MLEILLLIIIYRRLARAAVAKLRSPAWGWLGVGLWIAGEVLGAIIGIILSDGMGATYMMALGGAFAGVFIASRVVAGLEPVVAPEVAAFD